MPIARYLDEGTDQEASPDSGSNDRGSEDSGSSDDGSSSNDETRSGRATGSANPADRVDRATGRQESGKDTYKAPFNPDKFGVLGRKGDQQSFDLFDLIDKPNRSPSSRFSLEVDSKMPKSGVRTLDSIGQDGGSPGAHLYRGFIDAATGLIEGGLTGAALGTLTGGAVGGPPGAALGFSTGLIGGAAKGMVLGPIQGCAEGCHGFDIRNESKSSIIDRLEKKINSVFGFLESDQNE